MRIEWSQDAMEDLDAIFDYIAEDDPEKAFSFIQELREKAYDLLDAPRMGIVIEEIGLDCFRELHYNSYTFIYEIREDFIRIHEVYNQRRFYIRTYRRDDE